MVLPQGEFPVKGKQLENWLRTSYIPKGVTEGLSGNAMLQGLKDLGGQIRRQDFQQIRREVLGIAKHQEAVEKVGGDSFVPHVFINQGHGLDLGKKFQYRFAVTGVSPISGDALEWNYSLGANSELLAGQAEDAIRALIAGFDEFYGIIIDEITLIAVLADETVIL